MSGGLHYPALRHQGASVKLHRRKTTEHSGSSPRSPKSDSSSSPIGKSTADATSASVPAQMGPSRRRGSLAGEEATSESQQKSTSAWKVAASGSRSGKVSSGSTSAGPEKKTAGLLWGEAVGVGVRWGLVGVGFLGWLWSQAYVIKSMVGSTRLLSTCFLAGQPLELLHR